MFSKLAILFAIHFFILASLIAFAEGEEFEVLDSSKIYYGNVASFTKPGCISLSKIFLHIPEYRTILRRRYTTENAEYWVLLNSANETFRLVIKRVAAKYRYDLIGEPNSIMVKNERREAEDITHLALLCLNEITRK